MAKAKKSKLNDKQRLFVEHYVGDSDFNATRAAISAGYSARSAGQFGHDLLKKHEVIEAIADRLRELRETVKTRTENSYQERVDTAHLILSRCLQSEPVIKDGAVIDGEYTFDARGSLAANDQLAKLGGHYAAEKQKVELSGSLSLESALDQLEGKDVSG